MKFIRYETAGSYPGRIRSIITPQDDDPSSYIADGFDVLPGTADGNAEYVLDGEVISRPKITPSITRTIDADGSDETTFSTVPVGTMLRIDRENACAIDDGSFQFTTVKPGIYQLAFMPPWPYQNQIVTVTANAP